MRRPLLLALCAGALDGAAVPVATAAPQEGGPGPVQKAAQDACLAKGLAKDPTAL